MKENKDEIAVGDYVLATKYSDGYPEDQWAIGFYAGITSPHYNPPRFDVIDGDGNSFRANGFRKIQKISRHLGAWMLKNKSLVESSGVTIWTFLAIDGCIDPSTLELNDSGPIRIDDITLTRPI